MQLALWKGAPETAKLQVELIFVGVQHHERGNTALRELPAHLRPDGACRPGDESDPTRNGPACVGLSEQDGLTRQEVLRREILEHRRAPPLVEVDEGDRQDLELQGTITAQGKDLANPLRA